MDLAATRDRRARRTRQPRGRVTGGTQAEQYFEVDGRREMREPTMTVQGSGSLPEGDGPAPVDLFIVRVVGGSIDADETLTGRWEGRGAVLAGVGGSAKS